MLEYDLQPPLDGPAVAWVLVLHGLGDDRHGWKPVARELAIPRLGWIFVQAPEPYYQGWSWFPIPGLTDPHSTPADTAAAIARHRLQLRETIDDLLADLELPAERLFLMGFSQGCAMVLDQALRSDRVFAGVIGISGYLPGPGDYPAAFGGALARQHILWTHGDRDEMVPLSRPEEGRRHLAALGLAFDWRVYPKGHHLHVPDELDDVRDFITARLEELPV